LNNLVIVESPAKARSITKFLGKGYTVLSSMGHVRDLPKSTLGFDEKTFEPKYMVTKDKTKIVAQLKKEIKKDTTIYLAADEDREGEAIAWHLIYALKIQKHTIKRIVFHEITKNAILNAIKNPREVNQNLVDAQQARRILDRAVGYNLSPLLWKKIKYGLSAGRVQSVAVRLIVEKQKEIDAFKPVEYWKIIAKLAHNNEAFECELNKINDKKAVVNNANEAEKITNECKKHGFVLDEIVKKNTKQSPPPPFITSTLQQNASNMLGFSVKQTMVLAQQLYEGNFNIPNHTGGLITYMRTDSYNLSKEHLASAKSFIANTFGEEYVAEKTRVFKNTQKGAQEAHEAIRVVDCSITPNKIRDYVDNGIYALYKLIYNRTLSVSMSDAQIANMTYKITSGDKKQYVFSASGKAILFDGFLALASNSKKQDIILPNIKQGTKLDTKEILPTQHFTKPPAKYTEASLVKELEKNNIGRPSTYAPTISTIQTREYVLKDDDKKLNPTVMGKLVNEFLCANFKEIVDYQFTANMEQQFDEIANGNMQWKEIMKSFYTKFSSKVKKVEKDAPRVEFVQAESIGVCKATNKVIKVGEGRYGPYVQLGEKLSKEQEEELKLATKNKTKTNLEKPRYAPIPKGINPKEISVEYALKLLSLPKILGKYSDNDVKDEDIKVNIGRFGPYVQVKSEFYSIKNIDPYEITLPQALEVIKEAKEAKAKAIIKEFKKEEISILNGRYGPYIKYKKKNYKLDKKLHDKAGKLELDEVIDIIKKLDKTPTTRARANTKTATRAKTKSTAKPKKA